MSDYPEHDKLHEVAERSQAIGEFLDFGLPKQNLVLYEKVIRDCECKWCSTHDGDASGAWHTEEEKATCVKGRVQITEYVPTHRTIKVILAEHFGIDQAKIDEEKDQMLADMRALSDGAGAT